MCAHFQFTEEDEELRAVVRDALKRCPDRPFSPGQFAPGQWAPVLTAYGGRIVTDVQKWGLPSPRGGLIINARAETAAERPVFAGSVRSRRCVVPTTGFFEWDAGKHKYLFRIPGSSAVYLAGLFDSAAGVSCFVILTTAPCEAVKAVHDRMPLVLPRDGIRPWLTDAGAAQKLLFAPSAPVERIACDGQLSL